MPQPPLVFVSYTKADRSWAFRWLRRLRRMDGGRINWFIDQERLEIGDSLPDRLRETIHGASALVLMDSPDSARSAWVAEEVTIALEQGLMVLVVTRGAQPYNHRVRHLIAARESPCADREAIAGEILRVLGHRLNLAPPMVRQRLLNTFMAMWPKLALLMWGLLSLGTILHDRADSRTPSELGPVYAITLLPTDLPPGCADKDPVPADCLGPAVAEVLAAEPSSLGLLLDLRQETEGPKAIDRFVQAAFRDPEHPGNPCWRAREVELWASDESAPEVLKCASSASAGLHYRHLAGLRVVDSIPISASSGRNALPFALVQIHPPSGATRALLPWNLSRALDTPGSSPRWAPQASLSMIRENPGMLKASHAILGLLTADATEPCAGSTGFYLLSTPFSVSRSLPPHLLHALVAEAASRDILRWEASAWISTCITLLGMGAAFRWRRAALVATAGALQVAGMTAIFVGWSIPLWPIVLLIAFEYLFRRL